MGYLFEVEFVGLDVGRKYKNKSRVMDFGYSKWIFLWEEDLD